jgi:hypothetical protein
MGTCPSGYAMYCQGSPCAGYQGGYALCYKFFPTPSGISNGGAQQCIADVASLLLPTSTTYQNFAYSTIGGGSSDIWVRASNNAGTWVD